MGSCRPYCGKALVQARQSWGVPWAHSICSSRAKAMSIRRLTILSISLKKRVRQARAKAAFREGKSRGCENLGIFDVEGRAEQGRIGTKERCMKGRREGLMEEMVDQPPASCIAETLGAEKMPAALPPSSASILSQPHWRSTGLSSAGKNRKGGPSLDVRGLVSLPLQGLSPPPKGLLPLCIQKWLPFQHQASSRASRECAAGLGRHALA